jgi:hypothetical protein
MRDLMFAKFDPMELVESTDNLNRFDENGAFRHDLNYFFSVPHWSRLTTCFSGIHVDPFLDANSDVFQVASWDLDTVAIWNAHVLTSVRVFRKSVTQWTYEA